MRRITASALALLVVGAFGCSDDPPPPPPSGPLFTEAFNTDLSSWDAQRGVVEVVDVPDAPSPPKALRAQSIGKRNAALVRKSLQATGDPSALTCRYSAKVSQIGGTAYLTIGRLDVAGGAVLVDVKGNEWHFFGTFGEQTFAGGGPASVAGAWTSVRITIEKTGKVVVSFGPDERTKQFDVTKSPIDIEQATLEIGLSAPPPDFDTEAFFDNVDCSLR